MPLSKFFYFLKKEFLNILISFIAAVMICYYISDEITGVRTFEVPIHFVLPNQAGYKGVKIVWTNLHSVKVTIKGPKAKINFLPSNLVMRPVILSGTPLGEKTTLPLSPSYLNLPEGVTVLEIFPKQIQFILSRLTKKKIPVELNLNLSKKPPNIQIEFFEPKSVFIRGPEYILKKLKKVKTSFIHWKNITSSRIERYSI
ncbi:MAG: hypothetical protein D6785_07025, partial [Planctomycetota bacterium]